MGVENQDELIARIEDLETRLQTLVTRVAGAVSRHIVWFQDDEDDDIDLTTPDAALAHLESCLSRFVARVNELEAAHYTANRHINWLDARIADIAASLDLDPYWGAGSESAGQPKSSEALAHEIIAAVSAQIPTHG